MSLQSRSRCAGLYQVVLGRHRAGNLSQLLEHRLGLGLLRNRASPLGSELLLLGSDPGKLGFEAVDRLDGRDRRPLQVSSGPVQKGSWASARAASVSVTASQVATRPREFGPGLPGLWLA